MTALPYRTALVTGASSGIGRAIAVALAAAGFKVLALGRDRDKLLALSDACGAVPISLDIVDREGLIETLAAHEIDILVNNAGLLTSSAPFADLSADDIDAMVDVNVRSVFHLTHHVVRGLAARKAPGHLFFLGSSAGLAPHPNATVYGATKAAVSMFAAALRCDLLGQSIRVTEIAPGRVETGLYRTALGPDGARARLYDGYEVIQPEDIATLLMTALTMPLAVDVSRLEVFPTTQAVGGAQIVKSQS